MLKRNTLFALGTANPLNDGSDSGGYDHITLCQELSVMDVEMLKFVNSQITPGMICLLFSGLLCVT